MANFIPAYERTLINEGGYKLHNVKNDRGGLTYAGIARNRWPEWEGWNAIDAGSTPASSLVRDFYRNNFWNAIRGDQITNQSVAENLYDFAVNAGAGTAIKIAQIVVGTTPDGKIGPKTLDALNSTDPKFFGAAFALGKLARYEAIVTKDRTQERFLLGWLRRTLKEAA